MTKPQELAQELKEFIDEHPELRFWQALRVWADVDRIEAVYEGELMETTKDTFYWNNKNEL